MRGNQLPIDRLMTEGVRRPDGGKGTGGESGDMAEGGEREERAFNLESGIDLGKLMNNNHLFHPLNIGSSCVIYLLWPLPPTWGPDNQRRNGGANKFTQEYYGWCL